MIFDVLQLIGGSILSFGYIPQFIQIVKTRSASDLNLKTFIMMLAGITLMEVYAINLVLHGAGGAFLITNTISLISSSIMVFLICKYGKRNSANR